MKKQGTPAIAFLATLPPPLGGYSVGLKRLVRKLDEQEIAYTVYDLIHKKIVRPGGAATNIRSRAVWLLRYLFFGREDLVCCHYGDWRAVVFVGAMGLLGRRTLLSIGGWKIGLTLEQGGWLRCKVIIFALRRYADVIAHNEDIRQMCLSLGVRAERVSIIPFFIPPAVEAEDIAAIPANIREFMAGHRPVIAVNAFEMTFFRGQDLYGLDLCVELCARLKKSYPDIGFVFSLARTGDEDYFHKMERRITELDLGENFRILKGECQFYPILMKSQVFLRPTNTDGDANSLREALYFKVPSVASDASPRPEGTVIFKNRDIEDLVTKVEGVLQDYHKHKKALENLDIEDNSVKLIELYRKLMGAGTQRNMTQDLKLPGEPGREFWEDTWREIPAGGYQGIERYLAINRKLIGLLRHYIPQGSGKVLEVGCARGKFLVQFARKFGYEAFGIDYSESGASLARENLRRARVVGTIICQDIFQTDLPEGSFEVVYSMGLIEHFADPTAIVGAHVRLLKKGGTLFITIPNLRRSLVRSLNNLTHHGRELLEKHNTDVMDKEVLLRLARDRDITVLKVDYFGPADLSGAFSNIHSRPLLYLAHLFNQLLGYLTYYLPASAYLSPYLVLIGRK